MEKGFVSRSKPALYAADAAGDDFGSGLLAGSP